MEILDIVALAARWRVSPRTVRRLVEDGVLEPVRCGGRVGYAWSDIWRAEGGPPPEGRAADYRARLLTPADLAALCPLAPSTLKRLARSGAIPSRRVGAGLRFVPAEIDAWLAGWRRGRRTKSAPGGREMHGRHAGTDLA